MLGGGQQSHSVLPLQPHKPPCKVPLLQGAAGQLASALSVRHSSMCAFSSAFSCALPAPAAGGQHLPQTGQATGRLVPPASAVADALPAAPGTSAEMARSQCMLATGAAPRATQAGSAFLGLLWVSPHCQGAVQLHCRILRSLLLRLQALSLSRVLLPGCCVR